MQGYSYNDNLCTRCKYYLTGDHECRKSLYIENIQIVVECEYFEDGEPMQDYFEVLKNQSER